MYVVFLQIHVLLKKVLKALWIIFSETINILSKLHKTNIFGMPPKGLPYSYVHSSL